MFKGFSHTVKGASHDISGIVCQDASAYQTGDNYGIAVVADGHGSKKHFRSNIGSQKAVEATLKVVNECFGFGDDFIDNILRDPDRIIRKIEKKIIALWNDSIYEHDLLNPYTEEEKSKFTEDEFLQLRTESIYGTTLIAVVITELFTFGFQVGDGSLAVVYEDGNAAMPMTYEESAPANVTASLCNTQAIDHFSSFALTDEIQPIAVFASTDGLYTSFGSEDDFLDYHSMVTSQLPEFDTFDETIVKNLHKRTRYGTQDDISLSCIFDPDIISEHLEEIAATIEENRENAAMRKAERLASLEKQRIKNALRQQRQDNLLPNEIAEAEAKAKAEEESRAKAEAENAASQKEPDASADTAGVSDDKPETSTDETKAVDAETESMTENSGTDISYDVSAGETETTAATEFTAEDSGADVSCGTDTEVPAGEMTEYTTADADITAEENISAEDTDIRTENICPSDAEQEI